MMSVLALLAVLALVRLLSPLWSRDVRDREDVKTYGWIRAFGDSRLMEVMSVPGHGPVVQALAAFAFLLATGTHPVTAVAAAVAGYLVGLASLGAMIVVAFLRAGDGTGEGPSEEAWLIAAVGIPTATLVATVAAVKVVLGH